MSRILIFMSARPVYVPGAQEIVTGFNIENASYGLTICAERSAMISGLTRTADRKLGMMAVTCLDGDPEGEPDSVMPCGSCRQFMAEFMSPNETIIVDKVGSFALKELLPNAFVLKPENS